MTGVPRLCNHLVTNVPKHTRTQITFYLSELLEFFLLILPRFILHFSFYFSNAVYVFFLSLSFVNPNSLSSNSYLLSHIFSSPPHSVSFIFIVVFSYFFPSPSSHFFLSLPFFSLSVCIFVSLLFFFNPIRCHSLSISI